MDSYQCLDDAAAFGKIYELKVELYTADSSVRELLELLAARDHRLCAVHLVDSHYCSDPAKFISVCLTSLTTMLQVV
jgi:hypothetical protein